MFFLKNGSKNGIKLFIISIAIAGYIMTSAVGCSLDNPGQMEEQQEELPEIVKFGEKIESTADIAEIQEEKEKNKVEMKSQEELEVMLTSIQKWVIYEKWHFEEEELYYMPNYREDDRVYLKAEVLEEVIFYQDVAGTIYFIPTSMVNKSITTVNGEIQIRECEVEGQSGYYLYCYEYDRKEWRRPIYPEPDKEYIRISCTGDMKDKMEEIYPIGVAKVPFPQNIPQEAFESKLYENEYTDAVVDIIHSWLFEKEEYGEYKIYIGNYGMSYNSATSRGYFISITVAIVPTDKGLGYSEWWIFRAKDTLGENGKVIVETDGGANHSFPGRYDNYERCPDIFGSQIERIIKEERLVIPLTVQEGDLAKPLEAFTDEDDTNTLHFYLE